MDQNNHLFQPKTNNFLLENILFPKATFFFFFFSPKQHASNFYINIRFLGLLFGKGGIKQSVELSNRWNEGSVKNTHLELWPTGTCGEIVF